jgi:hypothetical protein
LVEFFAHGVFDFGLDLHAPSVRVPEALAEDEANGALDVIAFFQSAFGLGDDVPGGGNSQAGGPEDRAEIGPDAGVLMGEHHDLQAIVGHVLCHGGIGGHHVAAKMFILAFDREIALSVPGPLFLLGASA